MAAWPCLNFINNQFVPALGGATLDNTSPATGATLCQLPRSQACDADAAIASAVGAYPAWARTPVPARAALLDRVADLLERDAGALAQLEAEDSGKTLKMATSTDIPRAVANFRFFAGALRHDHGGAAFHTADSINFTSRHPLGVACLITPWNLPLYLLSWKVAPALACGNTVVCKPSEFTPRTACALAALLREAGAPPGVFNVLHGLGSECGARLVAHPAVRLVSFTGGTATGALVAATAAPLFKRLSLELGGKNATVIFADVPLPQAVAAAVRAGFTNNGQVCLCGSRVFVQRALYEAFCAALGEAVGALVVGDPSDPATAVGPLCSAQHRDKVASYIRLGLEEGGRALAGGEGPPPNLPARLAGGYFLRPTALAGLDARTSRCAREEVFGPLVTVHAFDTEEEVVEAVNDSRYGLCASVWTENLTVAHRVARALEVGMVCVGVRLRWRALALLFLSHSAHLASLPPTMALQVGEHVAAPRPAHALWRVQGQWRGQGGRAALPGVLLRDQEHLHSCAHHAPIAV
jgi:aminomuconate-semialdehyde/2-hydroxymuconate-6-semialdehyde dehydrogenase